MSRRKKVLLALIALEIFLVAFLPYCLSLGRLSVPFPFLRADYSYTISIPEYASLSASFVLSTGNIVNSSYIEVTEAIVTVAETASGSYTFYISLINRSVLIDKELLPELPPHGEYYDLWIDEGHAAGDAIRILNQTAILSSSGLRFYGWTFFNTLMASDLEFNCSTEIDFQGKTVPADYQGNIRIIYDQETGLMLEDKQSWTVNYVDSGTPQTLSYSTALVYKGSNVRFAYSTYALTTGIYSVLIIIAIACIYAVIHVWRKRRAEELALEESAEGGALPPMPPEEGPSPPPPPPPRYFNPCNKVP
jgi:hypothetical protein